MSGIKGGGPPSRKEALYRARQAERIHERRRRVWALYCAGEQDMLQIAKTVGCSNFTVNKDIVAVHRARYGTDLAAATQVDADRLRESLWRTHMSATRFRDYRAPQVRVRTEDGRTVLREPTAAEEAAASVIRGRAHESILGVVDRLARLNGHYRPSDMMAHEAVAQMLKTLTHAYRDLFMEVMALEGDGERRRAWADGVSRRVWRKVQPMLPAARESSPEAPVIEAVAQEEEPDAEG